MCIRDSGCPLQSPTAADGPLDCGAPCGPSPPQSFLRALASRYSHDHGSGSPRTPRGRAGARRGGPPGAAP
eukprot:9529617-Alexandrium_andersonii.AAC.1